VTSDTIAAQCPAPTCHRWRSEILEFPSLAMAVRTSVSSSLSSPMSKRTFPDRWRSPRAQLTITHAPTIPIRGSIHQRPRYLRDSRAKMANTDVIASAKTWMYAARKL